MESSFSIDLTQLIAAKPTDYLTQLAAAGLFYVSQKDADGHRQTPLVGVDPKHVSEYWFNPNKISSHESLMSHLVDDLARAIKQRLGQGPFVFCGLIPRGGCSLASRLASVFRSKYIQLGVRTVISQEDNEEIKNVETVWAELKPNHGDKVILVDGLFDPSQINQAIGMMWLEKITLTAVVGIINPISALDVNLATTHYGQVPLICLVKQPTPVYPISHKFVAQDVVDDNVIWPTDVGFIHQVRRFISNHKQANNLAVII